MFSTHVRHTLARRLVERARPIFLFALVALGVIVGPAIALAQQLNLSWVDNSGGLASFIIQRAPSAAGTYTQIAQVPRGVTSYTDNTVSLGTTYCYQVAAVTGAGISAFSNLACGSPSGGFTLTATKAGTGVGTVASSPAGIDCGTTCSYTYLAGKVVTLTATPSSGSTFSGWSGGGCSGTDPCTLVGNGSLATTATFTAGGPAATVNSVAPNQGAAGAVVPVTINGSRFAVGAKVSVSGTGVTVSNVSVGSATQLTATLTIAGGAALGARDVTVTNSGGGSGTLTGGFTVASAGPATLAVAYNGMLRDRVGQGHVALGADGALDGTLTVTLNASGGRTITYLRLDSRRATSELIGVWDTNSGQPIYWALGAAPTLDGAMVNNPGSMAVNFAVANGGSFALFASDLNGIEFLSGNTLTVTATFSDGSTARATTTVASASTVASAGPATLVVAYNGMLRDRVGQGHLALGADGALDGTLTVTLNASGGRTITYLRLDSRKATNELIGVWDTNSGQPIYWALGAAPTLDGAMLNNSGSMAVNFPVANGGSFALFAADLNGIEFISGNTLTVTATFADGSTATATTTVASAGPATLALAYNGMLRDRVGQGHLALGADGTLDGTLTVTLNASRGRTITYLRLDSRKATNELIGVWDTNSGQPIYWALGAAPTLDGAMVNNPGSMAVNFAVANGGSFALFASDLNGIEFLSGNTLTVTATFSDGSTASAVTTAP